MTRLVMNGVTCAGCGGVPHLCSARLKAQCSLLTGGLNGSRHGVSCLSHSSAWQRDFLDGQGGGHSALCERVGREVFSWRSHQRRTFAGRGEMPACTTVSDDVQELASLL